MKCQKCGQQTMDPVKLTPRQNEVLLLLSKGYSVKDIAEMAGCADSTVRDHLKSIYFLLDVNNRVEAAVAAVRMGMPV